MRAPLQSVFILVSAICAAGFFSSCSNASNNDVAGSVSETTNGSVSGEIVVTQSEGTGELLLIRRHQAFRMGMAVMFSDTIIQTSNENSARFSFENLIPGEYVLSFYDPEAGGGFVKPFTVDSAENVQLGTLEAQALANLTMNLSNVNTLAYETLIIPELNLEKSLADAEGTLLNLGPLPPGEYRQVYLQKDSLFLPLLARPLELLPGIDKHQASTLRDMMSQPWGYFALSSLAQRERTESRQVSSFAELQAALENGSDQEILISGMIAGTENLNVPSQTTIRGLGFNSGLSGFGLKLQKVQNVILENLNFVGANPDALMLDSAIGVWVDQCSFHHAEDELVSVTKGSDSITISWSRFYDSPRALLLGNADNNEYLDSNRIHVSLHHNWFEGLVDQVPRVRYGTVQIHNNIYTDIEGPAIASTMFAHLSVTDNIFRNVNEVSVIGHTSPENGQLIAEGNLLLNSPEIVQNGGMSVDRSNLPVVENLILLETIRTASGPKP